MQQVWTALGPEWSKIVIWIGVGIALLVALTVVVWLLMKIFGRSLNMGSGSHRGQPQRLGITGAFNVDRKGRKLVIVRRDNVEHLLLIGGPNDILVENNIIRAERAQRAQVAGADSIEAAPVVAPQAPTAAPTVKPVVAPVAPPTPPVRREPPVVAPPPPTPVVAKAPELPPAAVKAPELPPVIVATPVEQKPAAPVLPPSPPVAPTVEAPTAPETPPARPAPDPRLSDMARRLQSVLQRPLTPVQRPAPAQAAVDMAETKPIPLPSARKAEPAQEAPPVSVTPPKAAPQPEPVKAEAPPVAVKPPKVTKPAEKPAEAPVTQGKDLPASPVAADPAVIDSLEEEMARLLGRPGPGKV